MVIAEFRTGICMMSSEVFCFLVRLRKIILAVMSEMDLDTETGDKANH